MSMSVGVRGFVDIIVRSVELPSSMQTSSLAAFLGGGGGGSQRNVGTVLEGEPSAASETCHLSSTSVLRFHKQQQLDPLGGARVISRTRQSAIPLTFGYFWFSQ